MKPEVLAANIRVLLHDILYLLIEYPRDIKVTYKLQVGRIEFEVMPNINDQGRVVGRDGAHIKALQCILARIGHKFDQQIVVELKEDQNGRRIFEPVRAPNGLTVGCTDAGRVLGDIAAAVSEEEARIRIDRTLENGKVIFTLGIYPASKADYDNLMAPGPDGMSVYEAAGVLYKAVGKRNGIEIKVDIWP